MCRQPSMSLLIGELRSRLDEKVLQSLYDTGELLDTSEARVVALLRRFIVAEKLNVEKALERLTAHAAWRQVEIPNGVILEDEVQAQISQNKIFLQPPGADGRPLLVIRVARHFAIQPPEELERFVIFCLEAASRICDDAGADGKLCAVFDLTDSTWSNMDRHGLFSCFNLLKIHFPERVLKIFMLNAPFVFDALWRIVSPFIDPTSRQKVKFVSGDSGLKEILQQVDPAIVPQTLGGQAAEEVPAAAAAREALEIVKRAKDAQPAVDEEKLDRINCPKSVI